jgi:hypothetical protein
MGRGDDYDGSDDDEEDDDNVKKQQSVDATNADNGEEGTADSSLGVDVNLNTPEASWRKSDEERELMLLEAAIHIKMACFLGRVVDLALYETKVLGSKPPPGGLSKNP